MNVTHSLPVSNTINLRRLVVLRCIALVGQLLAVWVAVTNLHMMLPLQPLVGIIAAMALFNLLTWWRLRLSWQVTERELFIHLALDVAALTGLLYFSGGSTNPFVTLYLLPLALAAAALPGNYVWGMAAISVVCYSALMFFYVPLAQDHVHHGDDFSLHVIGMWLGFVLSAGIIAWFAVRMAGTRRERDRLLAEMRENALRHERILALGTLAAGAAHELGTPLSTMAVITKEMAREAAVMPGMGDNLRILRDQIDRCKTILSNLSASAGQTRAEGGRSLSLEDYLDGVLRDWQATRLGITPRRRFEGPRPSPEIVAEHTLSQAITNILNNAADASPESVDITARWSESELVLEVCDRGKGLTEATAERVGQPFFTTKEPGKGLGLGLFLTHATLNRFGGAVRLYNQEGGGVCTQLTLPISNLLVKSEHDPGKS
jgi:two-component system sensor histidine kinase RegB